MSYIKPIEPEKYFERYYMTQSRRKIYVALEDLNFVFDEADLPEIINMWEQGLAIIDIAKVYKRDPDEITCLIMSLAREGKIKPRFGGAFGRRRMF